MLRRREAIEAAMMMRGQKPRFTLVMPVPSTWVPNPPPPPQSQYKGKSRPALNLLADPRPHQGGETQLYEIHVYLTDHPLTSRK